MSWRDAPIVDFAAGGTGWRDAPLVQEPEPTADQPRPGPLQLINEGIASGLGAPIDLVASILNAGVSGVNNLTGWQIPLSRPLGGSASIEQGMNTVGIGTLTPDQQPEGLVENALVGLGGAAGSLGPFMGAARLAQGTGGVVSAVGDVIMQPFAAAPARAVASELAAGAGAGIGVDVADNIAPDSPFAPLVGAIVGGTAAGAGPYAITQGVKHLPLVSGATRMVQSELAPFTEAGAMERARARVGNLVEDPAAALAGLNEPTIGGLSPAVSSGDRRLMALEQTVRDTDPVVDLIMRRDDMEGAEALRNALREPANGVDSSAARTFMEDVVEREIDGIGHALDATLGPPLGVHRTSVALREGSAPARASAYDEAYDQPIDFASSAGQQLEVLLARVEQAAPGTIALANRMMAGEGVQSPQMLAQIADDGTISFSRLPDARQIDYITRALNYSAWAGEGKGALGGQTDMGRILGGLAARIRGALREANPAYAEALQTAATPIRQREALLLGQEFLSPAMPRDRAAAMIEGMTSPELALVRQGVRSQFDEILANVRASVAVPDVGMRQAQQTLSQLSAPAVREKLRMLMPANVADEFFARIDNAAGLLDGRRSGPALYVGARPNEEIRAVLSARDPATAVAQLVAETGNDPSSRALSGIKGAFIDELMARARAGTFDEAGEAVLSGRAMQSALNDARIRTVANGLLSAEERSRLIRIVGELTRIETARGRLPSVGAVMEGEPNSLVSMFARMIAARVGAHAGRGASGASLLTAHFASQRMKRILQSLTLDKAEALIRRAVAGDRELFEALLTPANRVTARQESRLAQVLARTAIGTVGGGAAASEDEPSLVDTVMRR